MKPIDEFDLPSFLTRYREQDNEFYEVENGIKLVQSGDWQDEGKYSYRSDTYQHVATGRFFAISKSRSGSYFTDYDYGDPDIFEVYPHVVTRIEYHTKPQEQQ
jgi:hypothetical protein